MKRMILSVALFLVACCAVLWSVSYSQSSVAHAQCTRTVKGAQVTTPNGTLVCDCTASEKLNCNCIVSDPTCGRGGGGLAPMTGPGGN